MTRVLLGEFEPMVRVGLMGLLAEAGCEVVAEETLGASLIERTQGAAPDVVIVDHDDGSDTTIVDLTVAFPALLVVACSSETPTMRVFPRFHHGESYACPLSPETLADVAQDR